MIETILLVLALQAEPDIKLQAIAGFTTKDNCQKVIDIVRKDEKESPVEPLIADKLACITVYYKPLQDQQESDKDPVVKCKSRKFFGKELACGKEM